MPTATRPAPATTRPAARPGRLHRWSPACARVGAAAALTALALVWGARAAVGGSSVYVSQLGATGAATAPVVNAALLLLSVGGLLVAVGVRGRRADVAVLGAWSTSTSLAVAGAAFAVASRVTCTAGCPVPLTPGATTQDLGHVVAAVLGFAAAGWAMLQTGWTPSDPVARTASRVAAVAVAGVSAAGGLLSVAGAGTDVGAWLELSATTVAVLWLAGLAATATDLDRPAGPRARSGRR